MKVNQHKKDQFEQQVLQEMGLFLRRTVADPRLQFVSVTKVIMNNDYSEAKVYWDTFKREDLGTAMEAMKKLSKRARAHLAGVLRVRHIPHVTFWYDEQYEAEKAVTKILTEECL